jgi:CheY-like chemotaxis protein
MTTLLIVDDDADDIQIFCDAAYELDKTIHCFSASNGEAGLELLKNAIVKPDFIFLDLNMPRMNGNQFLVQLKKDPLLQHIPVIIYTTSKREKDAADTLKLGAAYFLTKPVKFTELKKALSAILEKKWRDVVYSSQR